MQYESVLILVYLSSFLLLTLLCSKQPIHEVLAVLSQIGLKQTLFKSDAQFSSEHANQHSFIPCANQQDLNRQHVCQGGFEFNSCACHMVDCPSEP